MVMFYPLWVPMLLIPIGTGLMALVMVIALIAEVKAPGKNKGMEASGDSGRGVN
jgi:TRAP-type C4-dicarboxylate transport system permease small subunit